MPSRSIRFASLFAFGAASLASYSAVAQDAKHDWQKTYTVGSTAALNIETSDSAIEIHSCGDCKEIRIHAQGEDLNKFELSEHQNGDRVNFLLKEKNHTHTHWIEINNIRNKRTLVSVETPAKLQLEARTDDGNLTVSHLEGDILLHSGDGSVSLDSVQGMLRLSTSDGDLNIHQSAGTLEAKTSDGRVKIDGQFTAVQIHSSDGSVDVTFAPGTKLTAASNVSSSDGAVSVTLPHDLAANLDIAASDGRIKCNLPLMMDGYDSGSSHSHVQGKMNAGGVPLNIHSADGNITVSAI